MLHRISPRTARSDGRAGRERHARIAVDGRCAGGVRRQFSSSANVVMQQLSVQLLSGLEAETGVDPEFRHIGYLFVLTSDSQVADFRRLLPMWHKTGVTDARWLEPHEVRELAPLVHGVVILGGS